MDPPKAQWDAVAAQYFCECAANQVRKGNRLTKFLTLAGYKGLAEEFNAKTGRNYEKKKFKNRWDDLKSIYSAWVFYKNKSTGLGWDDVKQTITADDDQWAELIKIHKPIRAFRKGPPDNLKELTVMFEVYDEENETPAPSPVQPKPKHPAPMSASAIPHSPSKMSVPFTDAIGDRATKYLTWLVAFKVSCFQMRKSDIGQPVNVKPLLIIIGGANVDGLSIPVPPNPKHKEASAITCSPSKLQKNNVSRDFNDDISAIMEEVAKCGASETSDVYFKERKK